MEIKTELITPAKAKLYLEKNLKNRTLKQKIVNYYSDQMKKGIWLAENGDTIKISKSGVLLDGQHRLTAIIKSGVSLKMTIAYDIAENAFEFIDIGTARTAGDVLSVASVKNSNIIASIIKDYNGLKSGVTGGHRSIRLSNHEVLEIYKTSPEKFDFISSKAQHLYRLINGLIAPTVIGSYYLYLKEYAPNHVDKFFEKLCEGTNLEKSNPVIILREKFLNIKLGKEPQLTSVLRYVFIVKTWNAFLSEKPLQRLRYSYESENIPTPLST